MIAEAFVDTNVLLYAISRSSSEDKKARKARQLLGEVDFGLSTQVLQEFFVNATQKIRTPISNEDALRFIEIVSAAPVVPIDTELVLQAISFKQRFGLSYWDAAIVAAAHALGATTLFTEDLNAGQRYGDILAVNPFR